MATLRIDQRTRGVDRLWEDWEVIDSLMGGTSEMRRRAEQFLPKWPNEEEDSYKLRLRTATLFPAFRRTVSVMSGKPFSKALTLAKDTPSNIVDWAQDIDKEGVNLHSFAAEMFIEAMSRGFGGILVESPTRLSTAAGREPTRAEQQAAGVRPYWVRVKHDQILGWRTEWRGGAPVLTQLRIRESRNEADGEYGEREVERVRVLTPGAYTVYESATVLDSAGKAQTSWRVAEEGTTGLSVITFVPIYGFRKGFMHGEPPLLDLAYMNIKHWQSQSDQDTILHVARVPILFFKMLGETRIVVGGSHAICANHEQADGKFIEHSGAAISAGKESLAELEQQMIQAGAELLVKKPGSRSATESGNDAEANKCDLQRIAETFEDSLDLALYYTALYSSATYGGKVSLFKDYGAATLQAASGQLVMSMQASGLITKATAIKEMQRRGELSPDLDPETELAAVQVEGPEPGDEDDADRE